MALIGRCCSRATWLKNISNRSLPVAVARLNTSQKDKDTSSVSTPNLFQDGLPEKFDARVTNKHWVSLGYDVNDREKDVTFMHIFYFGIFTYCFVLGGFYIMYAPYRGFRDWSQREAYLEIRRREELGLPYIDRDLIPADKIVLPSDEELGDTKIII